MTPQEMELAILGIAYRAEHYDADRAGSVTLARTDPISGLPISANDLAARAKWLRGTDLAMQVFVSPKRLAPAMVWRVTDQKEETPISMIPSTQWSDEEADAVSQLEGVIRYACVRMRERGLLTFKTAIGIEGESFERDDGSPYEFRFTYKGLQEARKRVKGTRYDRRGPTIWDCMTKSQQANAQAQWAKGAE